MAAYRYGGQDVKLSTVASLGCAGHSDALSSDIDRDNSVAKHK